MTKQKQHPAKLEITDAGEDKEGRWFDAIITADVVDRQGERLDPHGFTLKEYRDILQAPIHDTHSNVQVGRFEPDSLKYVEVEHDGKKVNAISGRGRIFEAPKGYEEYPVWNQVWQHIKDHAEKGKPAALSIGGDPDPDIGKKVVCDKGSCHVFVPKVFWHETSIVRDERGGANPVAVTSNINAMAKGPTSGRSAILKFTLDGIGATRNVNDPHVSHVDHHGIGVGQETNSGGQSDPLFKSVPARNHDIMEGHDFQDFQIKDLRNAIGHTTPMGESLGLPSGASVRPPANLQSESPLKTGRWLRSGQRDTQAPYAARVDEIPESLPPEHLRRSIGALEKRWRSTMHQADRAFAAGNQEEGARLAAQAEAERNQIQSTGTSSRAKVRGLHSTPQEHLPGQKIRIRRRADVEEKSYSRVLKANFKKDYDGPYNVTTNPVGAQPTEDGGPIMQPDRVRTEETKEGMSSGTAGTFSPVVNRKLTKDEAMSRLTKAKVLSKPKPKVKKPATAPSPAAPAKPKGPDPNVRAAHSAAVRDWSKAPKATRGPAPTYEQFVKPAAPAPAQSQTPIPQEWEVPPEWIAPGYKEDEPRRGIDTSIQHQHAELPEAVEEDREAEPKGEKLPPAPVREPPTIQPIYRDPIEQGPEEVFRDPIPAARPGIEVALRGRVRSDTDMRAKEELRGFLAAKKPAEVEAELANLITSSQREFEQTKNPQLTQDQRETAAQQLALLHNRLAAVIGKYIPQDTNLSQHKARSDRLARMMSRAGRGQNVFAGEKERPVGREVSRLAIFPPDLDPSELPSSVDEIRAQGNLLDERTMKEDPYGALESIEKLSAFVPAIKDPSSPKPEEIEELVRFVWSIGDVGVADHNLHRLEVFYQKMADQFGDPEAKMMASRMNNAIRVLSFSKEALQEGGPKSIIGNQLSQMSYALMDHWEKVKPKVTPMSQTLETPYKPTPLDNVVLEAFGSKYDGAPMPFFQGVPRKASDIYDWIESDSPADMGFVFDQNLRYNGIDFNSYFQGNPPAKIKPGAPVPLRYLSGNDLRAVMQRGQSKAASLLVGDEELERQFGEVMDAVVKYANKIRSDKSVTRPYETTEQQEEAKMPEDRKKVRQANKERLRHEEDMQMTELFIKTFFDGLSAKHPEQLKEWVAKVEDPVAESIRIKNIMLQIGANQDKYRDTMSVLKNYDDILRITYPEKFAPKQPGMQKSFGRILRARPW